MPTQETIIQNSDSTDTIIAKSPQEYIDESIENFTSLCNTRLNDLQNLYYSCKDAFSDYFNNKETKIIQTREEKFCSIAKQLYELNFNQKLCLEDLDKCYEVTASPNPFFEDCEDITRQCFDFDVKLDYTLATALSVMRSEILGNSTENNMYQTPLYPGNSNNIFDDYFENGI